MHANPALMWKTQLQNLVFIECCVNSLSVCKESVINSWVPSSTRRRFYHQHDNPMNWPHQSHELVNFHRPRRLFAGRECLQSCLSLSQSFCSWEGALMWLLPMMPWTSLYKALVLVSRIQGPEPWTCPWASDIRWAKDWRPVKTNSPEDTFTSADIWWSATETCTSGQYASFWNAFFVWLWYRCILLLYHRSF